MCRRCARAAGYFTRTEFERDMARLARQRAKVPPPVAREARPSIVRVIGGVEYEVTWDGA